MNTKKLALILPLALALHIQPVSARQSGKPVEQTALPDDQTATLIFMREEEKLARDLYISLYDLWEHAVFGNISDSEQKHMNAMARQLEKHDLPDPVVEDTVGVFQDVRLDGLYEQLLAQSETSLEQALLAGALIEELDISDLHLAIAESTHADITRVYANLLRGSRNHLRAFVHALESLGVVYTAQYMSQEEVNAIVDSPMERGGKKHGSR